MNNKIQFDFPDELKVACLGIVAIFFLEVIAILKGLDGVMFGTAMTAIGAIIGWVFKTYISTTKKQ